MRAPGRGLAAGGLSMALWLLAATGPGCGSGSEGETEPGHGGSTNTGGTITTGGGGNGGTACVPQDEICDGFDNDCDDDVDEDCPCIDGDTQDCYSGDPALIGIGECAYGQQTCDLMGQWGACEGEVLPGDDLCDGLDNDCDAATDEDLGSVTCGLGICQVTVPACEDGVAVPCIAGTPEPPEDCDTFDDDCDGEVDEDCDCTPDGSTDVCYSGSPATLGVGECHDGLKTCQNGTWGVCVGDQTPVSEICDGLDNDCNGSDDNGDPGGGANCDTGLFGICAAGVYHCVSGAVACVQQQQAGVDLCDTLDNDCDPATADGSGDPLVGVDCDGPDSDLCAEGSSICNGSGQVVCTDTSSADLDVCDGQDNDCDPSSADGSEDALLNTSCDGSDDDLCIEGTNVCVAGALQCSDNTATTNDLCNGVDDDCDATSGDGSEDPQVGAPCDGSDGDLCEEGTRSCAGGILLCSDNTANALDVCDGNDNDCDPASGDGSEDPQLGSACDGPDSDLCTEGTRSCDGGALVCDDETGNTLDLCDGLNNDCDPASTDGSEDPQVGAPCDGADGDLCEEGTRSCSGGSLSCSDTSGNTLDVCDSQDNDCDAASADGSEDPLLGTSCDGPDSDLCLEGTRSCVSGSLSCSDNTAGALDLCDSVDNDCDPASADGAEDPLVGVSCDGSDSDLCKEGTSSCSGGAVVCDDASGSTLDVCDGQDNDCDPSSIDGSEDPQIGTACDGPDSDLCNEGSRSCLGGVLSCSDTTGNTLDVCDGVDNDCDGASADGSEDPQAGTACDGSDPDLCLDGTWVCGGGVLSCSDGPGTGLDICDGIDNDCNAGTPDGSQDPLIGAPCDGADSDLCNEGVYSCSAGVLSCSDNTGHALDVCDGLDNDCDPASADGAEDATVGISCDGPDSDLCKEGTSTCSGGAVLCGDDTGSTTDTCDGQDNDCDPASADGSEDPLVGVSCDGPDSDLCLEGLSSCSAGAVVCSDNTTSTVDICNGANDDCDAASADGSEDALVGVSCDGADSDLCKEGTSSCTAGAVVCSDSSGSTVDLCNGSDDDCDPASGDGSEDPTVGVACDGADTDLCNEGASSCVAGAVLCSDNSGSTVDLCNGLDDDCDASSADGTEDPGVGVTCDGPDSDLCKEGTSSCTAGALVCSDVSGDNLDICNGLNDDCDAASSDGSEDPGVGIACDGADNDLCNEGTSSCSGGVVLCSDNTGHTLDICDGLDNDCDPASADGSEDGLVGVPCDGPDGDLCQEGTSACTAGSVVCSDNTANDPDVCNGVNDDCDASSPDGSEDPQVGAACDGPDSDLCTEGTRSCSGGSLVCSDNTGNTLDVCDGVNNDCDAASADGSEDATVGIPCDGSDSDLCTEGTSSCTAGSVVCSDNTGSTTDVCNGADDDCDAASADGSEDPQSGQACDGPDTDLCNEGTRSCTGGTMVCSDTTGSTVDLCNGFDDDCDGGSPDGSEDPQVGVGCDGPDSDLCQEGTRVCLGGALSCSDSTSSNLDLCNGTDDDCDAASSDGSEDPLNGQACDGSDSDLCQEGTNSCAGGVLSCSDSTLSTVDLCNGVDDDCDSASADGSEDPLNGQGCDGADSDLCLEGTNTCGGGVILCSDNTGHTLDICDGLDNDCDPASVDGAEDPQNGASCDGPDTDMCLEGTNSCTGGALVCSDSTGDTPEICTNGVDDDCDGSTDEGCGGGCAPGFGDCDGNPVNGCEAVLATDHDHCGSCPNACSGGQYCNVGVCTNCAAGAQDCDLDGANGCEAGTATDPLNCGGCGVTCGSDATCGCSSSSCSGGSVYFSEDFSDNGRGWSLGTEWGIGAATTSSGHQRGNPDPAQDHSATSDNGVAGIVIGGNYAISAQHPAEYLTSPVIDLSGASGTVLMSFWRWLNTDDVVYTTTTVEVFNGSTWVVLWTNPSSVNNMDFTPDIVDAAWSRQQFDVTSYKNANFRIRFGHAIGYTQYVPWIMSGWNIDDVSLSSATCN